MTIQSRVVSCIVQALETKNEEIETLITRPIEESIGSVSGIKRIESVSREGRSTITAAFNWGQNIDFAALGVREKIDLIKERLPKESDDPIVLKFDPLATPIMLVSVTGTKLEPARLKYLAEKMLKDRLDQLAGTFAMTKEQDFKRRFATVLQDLQQVGSKDPNVMLLLGSLAADLSDDLQQPNWTAAKKVITPALSPSRRAT